jgi:hypothetical protein
VHGVVPPQGTFSDDEEVSPDTARPRLLLPVGITVAVVAAGVVGWTLAGGGFPGGGGGVGASVIQNYNVHSGPANEAPVSGGVRVGDEVVVECLTPAGWARLQDPSPGGYVHRSGLDLEAEPPPC